MYTLIYTAGPTTLTIDAGEELLQLVQMGCENQPRKLDHGQNEVNINAGYFRLLSVRAVTVKADPSVHIVQGTKDGPTDPPKTSIHLNGKGEEDVRKFLDATVALSKSFK